LKRRKALSQRLLKVLRRFVARCLTLPVQRLLPSWAENRAGIQWGKTGSRFCTSHRQPADNRPGSAPVSVSWPHQRSSIRSFFPKLVSGFGETGFRAASSLSSSFPTNELRAQRIRSGSPSPPAAFISSYYSARCTRGWRLDVAYTTPGRMRILQHVHLLREFFLADGRVTRIVTRQRQHGHTARSPEPCAAVRSKRNIRRIYSGVVFSRIACFEQTQVPHKRLMPALSLQA